MADEIDLKKLTRVIKDERATIYVIYPTEVVFARESRITGAIHALLGSGGAGYSKSQAARITFGVIATHEGQDVSAKVWRPVVEENSSAILANLSERISAQTGRPKQRLEITSVEEQER